MPAGDNSAGRISGNFKQLAGSDNFYVITLQFSVADAGAAGEVFRNRQILSFQRKTGLLAQQAGKRRLP
ncbi:hypothetical protein [Pantoea cypripedii]|uniref:hypothetical protein n=1 Tax=Pantoea cypripedii TaxID=55209 RepID=UPI00111C6364|nr:hypothetical protein [Pantoea cypripedii]MBP2195002.1 hypothetical protein [Pantoea cypripedii]